MKDVSRDLLIRVEHLINNYCLFSSDTVYVAFSGGKDSLFLCICLIQLGYNVVPITIDIGFNANWNIAKRNLKLLNLELVLLKKEEVEQNYPLIKNQLNRNLELCETRDYFSTICTYCYNSKILILNEWTKENDISVVAFGHHAIDAISSFLKSFLMYYDRWKKGNVEYNRELFKSLVLSYEHLFKTDFQSFLQSEFYCELDTEFKHKHVGTDEPIKQKLPNDSTILCRPLLNVFESEIENYFANSEYIFTRAECFSTGNRKVQYLTPREMIQCYLLCNCNPDILHLLRDMVFNCIDSDGYLLYNVRKDREKILGKSYKSNMGHDKL